MQRKEEVLDRSYLFDTIEYNINTGVFIWKILRNSYGGRVRPGAIAGTVDRYGHRYITIDQVRYMAHRLAWFYVYGIWPIGEVDHKNMVSDDNRIENLRDVGLNRSLQRANQKVRVDSKLGIKGVRKNKNGKYDARLANKYLGSYGTPEEAHAVYVEAATRLFGEFARAA